MLNSKTIRSLTLGSVAAVLCGTGQWVFAHTTVKDQATEGTTAYNALQIGHTCEIATGRVDAGNNPVTRKLPVIAQSVVFPTVNPKVTRPDPNDPSQTIDIPLSEVISDAAGLAGKVSLVQDRSIFKKQRVVKDASGSVIGVNGTHGNLDPDLRGLVTFRFTPPAFVPSSCAKRLLVKVAIADICKRAFPPREGTANLWIPNATAKFTDTAIDGIGSPATLTVNRKPNTLDPACGEGYDVTISPSDEDINANLPIKGYWGN